MGRPKAKRNQERNKRLKQLLRKSGRSITDIAAEVGYSREHLSAMANGTRNVTEEAAERIAALFPPTRKEWLLCYDDYETPALKQEAEINAVNAAYNAAEAKYNDRINAFIALARLAGYDIEFFASTEDSEDAPIVLGPKPKGHLSKIKKDGKTVVYITSEKITEMALNTQRFVGGYLLSNILEEVSEVEEASKLEEASENG